MAHADPWMSIGPGAATSRSIPVNRARPSIKSAQRSAIMITGALVSPLIGRGMIQGIARRRGTPHTRSCGSTAAPSSVPPACARGMTGSLGVFEDVICDRLDEKPGGLAGAERACGAC